MGSDSRNLPKGKASDKDTGAAIVASYGFRIFHCGHAAHITCIDGNGPSREESGCPICSLKVKSSSFSSLAKKAISKGEGSETEAGNDAPGQSKLATYLQGTANTSYYSSVTVSRVWVIFRWMFLFHVIASMFDFAILSSQLSSRLIQGISIKAVLVSRYTFRECSFELKGSILVWRVSCNSQSCVSCYFSSWKCWSSCRMVRVSQFLDHHWSFIWHHLENIALVVLLLPTAVALHEVGLHRGLQLLHEGDQSEAAHHGRTWLVKSYVLFTFSNW